MTEKCTQPKYCITSDDVWNGIERLCIMKEKSLSGIAKKAGLDTTTLYRYKRTQSENMGIRINTLFKILTSEKINIVDFIRLCAPDVLNDTYFGKATHN